MGVFTGKEGVIQVLVHLAPFSQIAGSLLKAPGWQKIDPKSTNKKINLKGICKYKNRQKMAKSLCTSEFVKFSSESEKMWKNF